MLSVLIALTMSAADSQAAKLDEAWTKAVLKKDIAALEAMLDDGLIYGHASGILDTKKQYLDKLGSGKQVYRSMERKNVTERTPAADTIVTHSWMHVTGVNAQGPFDDKVMMLHVWVKKGQRWSLLAHQTAKVDKMP